jgi:cysteine desulfurase
LTDEVKAAIDMGEGLMRDFAEGRISNDDVEEVLNEARRRIAASLGLPSYDGLIFTSSGIEAVNYAVKGLAWGGESSRCEIVVVDGDPEGFGETASWCERFGFRKVSVTPGRDGLLDQDEIESGLSEKTLLVACSSVTPEVLVPRRIKPLANAAHGIGAKVVFGIDLELVCRLPRNALEVADMVTLEGSSVGGPVGSGIMWVRDGVRMGSLISGGRSQGGRRGGIYPLPIALGLASALEAASRKRASRNLRFMELHDAALEAVAANISDILLPWASGSLPSGLLFIVPDVEGEAVVRLCEQEGVFVSTGSSCSKATGKPSAVLLSHGFTSEEAAGAIMLNFQPNHSTEEITTAIEVVGRSVAKLRAMKPDNQGNVHPGNKSDV